MNRTAEPDLERSTDARDQRSRGSMPTRERVAAAWSFFLVDLGKREDVHHGAELLCFACGFDRELERAHIVAHIDGGTEGVENLHLLCDACHRSSEHLDGDTYDEWLSARQPIDATLERISRDPLGGVTRWRTRTEQDNLNFFDFLRSYSTLTEIGR